VQYTGSAYKAPYTKACAYSKNHLLTGTYLINKLYIFAHDTKQTSQNVKTLLEYSNTMDVMIATTRC